MENQTTFMKSLIHTMLHNIMSSFELLLMHMLPDCNQFFLQRENSFIFEFCYEISLVDHLKSIISLMIFNMILTRLLQLHVDYLLGTMKQNLQFWKQSMLYALQDSFDTFLFISLPMTVHQIQPQFGILTTTIFLLTSFYITTTILN